MGADHTVPKDRAALRNNEWLPFVISKLGPLEWWIFATSPDDIRRENFSSDFRYQIAKQNTWEFPRFCFSLFRPKPEVLPQLSAAVDEYKGDVFWVMHDDCINAMPYKPKFYTPLTVMPNPQRLKELARNPPQADPQFVRQAMEDVPKFGAYLEQRLGLTDKPPLDFDPQWITRDGLAASRGQFEEYWEPGSWPVFLALNPQKYAQTSQPTSAADRALAIGLGMFQHDALFEELGADWDSYARSGKTDPLLPSYPLLSRLSDITEDVFYERSEVDAFLAELTKAQDHVKDPKALRGLDNLIRIARWAQKLKLGIYFSGQ